MTIELSNGQTVSHFNNVVDMRRGGFNPMQPRDSMGRWSLSGTKGGRNPQEERTRKTASGAKGHGGQTGGKKVPKPNKGIGDSNSTYVAKNIARYDKSTGKWKVAPNIGGTSVGMRNRAADQNIRSLRQGGRLNST